MQSVLITTKVLRLNRAHVKYVNIYLYTDINVNVIGGKIKQHKYLRILEKKCLLTKYHNKNQENCGIGS